MACNGSTKIAGKLHMFLILSGIATGASWLCYYYAIQNGAEHWQYGDKAQIPVRLREYTRAEDLNSIEDI